jgi:hypothetical protein
LLFLPYSLPAGWHGYSLFDIRYSKKNPGFPGFEKCFYY